jgi:hypothetical protein
MDGLVPLRHALLLFGAGAAFLKGGPRPTFLEKYFFAPASGPVLPAISLI